MKFWIGLLNILKAKMAVPAAFGVYHLLWIGITVAAAVLLCTRYRNCSPETVQKVVFWVAVTVTLLELYKQIVFTFSVKDGAIVADYQWYIFPWQFCSMPMYVGLLTGAFPKGKVRDALYAFLATYAVFAGICVMLIPGDVFVGFIGVNIQTMICHSSMVVIGIWLLAVKSVELHYRTVWKGGIVFGAALAVAVALNEGIWHSGILDGKVFNMFYVSSHFPGTLAVYRQVQQIVPYPWCLIVYVAVFTFAACLVMLCARTVSRRAERKNAAAIRIES